MSNTLVFRTVLSKFTLAAVALAVFLPWSSAQAGTVVRELDESTLLVTEFRGKPPHKRLIVTADDAAAFAHYQAIMEQPQRRYFAGLFGGGAPGKSFPRSRRPRTIDASEQLEQAEFARFEEVQEAAKKPTRRFWRGAPGKGQPRVNN